MPDRVLSEIAFSGTRNKPKNGFTSFFAKAYSMIFAVSQHLQNALSTLKNSSNMEKVWQKKIHFSMAIPKPGFGVLDQTLEPSTKKALQH